MKILLCVILIGMLVLPCSARNMILNGDFETGDLSGWEASGPSYYTFKFQSAGAPPVPAQIFSADAPLSIVEVFYDDNIVRHQRPIGLLSDIRPSQGKWAVGWARSGWHHMGYEWVRQVFHVAPGKYLMNASWDVCIHNTLEPDKEVIAAMMMIHLDEYVDYYTVNKTAYRHMVWGRESRGEWKSQSAKDVLLETKTGNIEVRLQYLQSKLTPHATRAPLPPPHYEFVAFDNFVFNLTPVDADYKAEEEQK